MPNWLKQLLKALPLAVGLPVLLAAASVKPDDAGSNLALWVTKLGLHNLPSWVQNPHFDKNAAVGVVVVAAIYSAAVWIRPRKTRPSEDAAQSQTRPIIDKKCSIILGRDDPYVTTEPAGVNRRQFVRVKIKNNTNREITNGRLGIANLDPPNAGVSDCEIKSDICISADSEYFVDIACYDMGTAQAKPGKSIQLIVPRAGGFFGEAYAFAYLPFLENRFDLVFSRFSEVYDKIYCTLYLSEDRLLCLESKLAPASRAPMIQKMSENSLLQISTGERGRYFLTRSRGVYSTERTLHLKLKNASPSTAITDISVIVSSIDPQSDYEGPWTLEAGFSLPAGGQRYIPLASYGEASDAPGYSSSVYDRSDSFFEVLTEGAHKPTAGKEDPQIISIRATGFGTAPCDYQCKVWIERATGRLRVEDA